jgi:hypothetical protein
MLLGIHHDSITGVSYKHVHAWEKENFEKIKVEIESSIIEKVGE